MFSLVDHLKQLAVNVHYINDYIKTEVLVNIFFPCENYSHFQNGPSKNGYSISDAIMVSLT